jgi:hypothetical protein
MAAICTEGGYDRTASVIDTVLGEYRRFRPAHPESWGRIEDWLGTELPGDYRQFVDGFGDAMVLGHLFIPHPDGSDPLLTFMKEERETFHEACGAYVEVPQRVRAVWDRVVPWAYHDWDGDMCLLLPPAEGWEGWNVAVAFRQCPEITVFDGGVADFMSVVLSGRSRPRGWPTERVVWEPIDGSRAI